MSNLKVPRWSVSLASRKRQGAVYLVDSRAIAADDIVVVWLRRDREVHGNEGGAVARAGPETAGRVASVAAKMQVLCERGMPRRCAIQSFQHVHGTSVHEVSVTCFDL